MTVVILNISNNSMENIHESLFPEVFSPYSEQLTVIIVLKKPKDEK